jgi:hypothetical protein
MYAMKVMSFGLGLQFSDLSKVSRWSSATWLADSAVSGVIEPYSGPGIFHPCNFYATELLERIAVSDWVTMVMHALLRIACQNCHRWRHELCAFPRGLLLTYWWW